MGISFDLSGKTIIVTGAARGLGLAIARRAAASGATVAGFDIDEAALTAAAAGQFATYRVDVSNKAQFDAAAAAVASASGRIDAIVSNAMLIRYDPIEAVSEDVVDTMLGIGIKGAIWGAQALARHMDPARGGVLINMASPVAVRGIPGTAVYAMVKAAMGSLTRTLAAELGPRGVRVNALAPGSIPTPGATALTTAEGYEKRKAGIPLRRLGTDDDVSAAALYLLSDEASYVSGDTLYIDGGSSASL
jgi:NAD(P)-dependent dehydrogenase (short-subunit alcohol dehydrogenase family)